MLLAQPPPNLERLRIVTLGQPSAARPWPRGSGPRWRGTPPCVLAPLDLCRPPVTAAPKSAAPLGSTAGRLSPFFVGKAPVGGSALRRSAVSHDGRCGESLLEEQLLTDRCLLGIRSFMFLSVSILRFDQHVRQSGKKGRRGIKDLDPDEAWSVLTPRKTVPVTVSASPASQPK